MLRFGGKEDWAVMVDEKDLRAETADGNGIVS